MLLKKHSLILQGFIAMFLTMIFAVPSEASEAAKKQWIGSTVAPTLPGYVVEEHHGICWIANGYSGHGSFNEHIMNALNRLDAPGKENAVVNVRISQGSYDQQGSRWGTSSFVIYGDCVTLRRSR